MSIPIKIRPVTASDWAQFEMLVAGICNYHGDTHALNEQQFNQMAVGDNAPVTALVAETEDNVLAGFVTGYIAFNFSQGKQIFHIQELFVAEEFRRNRIGEVLMLHMFQIAKQKYGADNFRLAAHDWNNAAINFYKQLGFKENSQIHNSVRLTKEAA